MIKKQSTIRKNPTDNDLIKKIHIRKIKDRDLITYEAYLGNSQIGHFEIYQGDNFINLADIAPNFRRKGVATYIYDYIENDLGIKLRPSDLQLESHSAFWEKRLKSRQNPKSEIFKAISRSSKLPIYQAYMGFNTPIWRGNAKNEKDACARAYADTGTSPIFAKLWEKAIQNPKCKTIEVKRKIKILGKPRIVKVKRKICNPELDLARMKRLLASELSQYDQRLQKSQPNNYRLAIYFGAVDKAFARLDENSTLEEMKESICRNFSPDLPPVKKFLKKHT